MGHLHTKKWKKKKATFAALGWAVRVEIELSIYLKRAPQYNKCFTAQRAQLKIMCTEGPWATNLVGTHVYGIFSRFQVGIKNWIIFARDFFWQSDN